MLQVNYSYMGTLKTFTQVVFTTHTLVRHEMQYLLLHKLWAWPVHITLKIEVKYILNLKFNKKKSKFGMFNFYIFLKSAFFLFLYMILYINITI